MPRNFKRETQVKTIDRPTARSYHEQAINKQLDFNADPTEAGMGGCPWRICLSAILRQNTDKIRARVILENLLAYYPTPDQLATQGIDKLNNVIYLIHGAHRRVRMIAAFSQGWVKDDWDSLLDLPGVTALGLHAVALYGGQSGQVSLSGLTDAELTTLQTRPYRGQQRKQVARNQFSQWKVAEHRKTPPSLPPS